jgi:hypothetical protein
MPYVTDATGSFVTSSDPNRDSYRIGIGCAADTVHVSATDGVQTATYTQAFPPAELNLERVRQASSEGRPACWLKRDVI